MDRQPTLSRVDIAFAWAAALLGVCTIAWLAYKAGLPLWPSRVFAAIGVVYLLYGMWGAVRRGGVASRSSGDWLQRMIAPADDAAKQPLGFLRALLVPASWTAADGDRGDIARFLAPARDTPAAWLHVWTVWMLIVTGVGLVLQLTEPSDFPAVLGTFGGIWWMWFVVSRWREARRDDPDLSG